MAKRRQLALIKFEDPDDPLSPTVSLGSTDDFARAIEPFNTRTDHESEGGKKDGSGSIVFYGPGLVLEIIPMDGQVRQALVYCQNQDFAFPVLYRLCKANGWKIQDIDSGQMFG